MRICAGLVGPKIENMHATVARSRFLKGQMRGDVVRRAYIGRLVGGPGTDIGRVKRLFQRGYREVPFQTTSAQRAWRINLGHF